MESKTDPIGRPGASVRGGISRTTRFLRALLFGAITVASVLPAASSTAPATGTDVPLNGEGPNPLCNAQAEPHVAAFGRTVVAGWVDDRNCLAGFGLASPSMGAYAHSSDGGTTWTEGGFIQPPSGGAILSDPVLASDAEGTFYYTVMARDGSGRSIIGVSRSTDGGRTFSPVVDASPGRPSLNTEQDKPWLAVDATSAPHRGNAYVAWTEFVERDIDHIRLAAERKVLFSRSTDGAETFSDPIQLSVPVSLDGADPVERPGVGVQVAVGPGGEVYVAWPDYVVPDEPAQYRQWSVALWFARSLDGGKSFSTPELIARPTGIGHIGVGCLPPEPGKAPLFDDFFARDYTLTLDGNIKVRNWISMAVDTTGSPDPEDPDFNPYHGRIYLTFAHSPTGFDDLLDPDDHFGDEADVSFIWSETRGVTWEGVSNELRPRLALSDTAADGDSDQFHPTVAVDTEGRVLFTWYDRRLDPPSENDVEGPGGNWMIDLFGAVSTDGGETFVRTNDGSTNFRISDASFAPPQHHNPFTLRKPREIPYPERHGAPLPPIHGGWGNGCNHVGEYNGIAATGSGEFVVAWGDNRNATGVVSDMDVYADRVIAG